MKELERWLSEAEWRLYEQVVTTDGDPYMQVALESLARCRRLILQTFEWIDYLLLHEDTDTSQYDELCELSENLTAEIDGYPRKVKDDEG